MAVQTREQLKQQKCVPCEGGVGRMTSQRAREQIEQLDGWELGGEALSIHKTWMTKDFMSAIDFFNNVAEVAEQENHHPDLHLDSYRNVKIEISTHAIGGLSENDFILAAKIDDLPVELKKK